MAIPPERPGTPTPFERAMIPRSPTIHVGLHQDNEATDLLEYVTACYEKAKRDEAIAKERFNQEVRNKMFKNVHDYPRGRLCKK